ncbi:MAG: peptidylprolyl isomerase [Candidatus Schekmanbacteria bacterium]|nr:peptidylprolyl isomerase [Candidatus Schekmanbacteria bacterium]
MSTAKKFILQRIIFLALIVLVGMESFPVIAEETKTEEKKEAVTGAPKDKPKDLSQKVATVNGMAIYQAEMEMALKQAKMQLMFSGRSLEESQMAALEKETLETLIDRELLLQESQKAGTKIEDAAINEKIELMKKRFPEEAKFKEALAMRNLSLEELRNQIKEGLTLQQYVEKEIASKVAVTDEEAKKHYDQNQEMFKMPEQVKASHILIKVEPAADEAEKTAAHKKIEQIQERVKKGEDFAALAKEVSQCPSAEQGGDLGYFGRGRMVKPFEDTAFSINKDQVSDIITSDFGYHLIKVTDKKPEATAPFEEIKDRLKQYMKQMKVEEKVKEFAGKLRETAKIERHLTSAPAVSAAPAVPVPSEAAPASAPAKAEEGGNK